MSSDNRPKQSSFDLGVLGAVIQLEGICGLPTVDATTALRRSDADDVTGVYYLSIPAELIELVESALKPAALEPAAAELDKRLAEQSTAAGSNCVGFFSDSPLYYNSLHPPQPLVVTEDEARAMGWDMNAAKLSLMLRTGNERLNPIHEAALGYLGWLVTNAEFQREHDSLLAAWEASIRQFGLAGAGRVLVAQGPVPLPRVTVPADYEQYSTAVQGFLIRWRLVDLVGPMLPEPMQPLLAGAFPISILRQLMDAGGLFNIPDIFPIPSRDELRGMLADAIASRGESEHLSEWHKIIDRSSMAKNQIERYCRIRRLAHYWRLFHLHHAPALHRKASRLQHAFSEYLKVSTATIKSDLALIEERLGDGWESKPMPLSSGP